MDDYEFEDKGDEVVLYKTDLPLPTINERPLRSPYSEMIMSLKDGEGFTVPESERGIVATKMHYFKVKYTSRVNPATREVTFWRLPAEEEENEITDTE